LDYEEQDYSKQLDIKLWVKILGILKMFKNEIIMLAVMMAALAGTDAIFPVLSKLAIDEFALKGSLDGYPWFIAAYAATVIWQAGCILLFIRSAGRLESKMVYEIRRRGFTKLQDLSFSYYDKTPVGWIMSRMTSDAQRIGDVIAWGSIDLFWAVAIIILVAVIMFFLDWRLALCVLSVFPALAVVSVYFQRQILKSHRVVRKFNSKITGAYNEGINGARTTKTLVREDKNFDEFAELSYSMKTASVRAATVSAVYLPIVMSLGSIAVGAVLWAGGVLIGQNLITFGTYSVFIQYAVQIFDPIQSLARVFSEFQSAQAAGERTLALLDTQSDIEDAPEVVEIYGDSINPKPENWPAIQGEIVFKDVFFKYKTGEKVLENFNLTVKAGEKIALVGETGAGKSTIVNLLCRFYEPTSGQVLIDGTDYTKRSQIWLQSNLGYVLQSPHLFSGTIADNIRYAKLDATDEEVEQAAKTVRADEFINRLEKGYKTEVGEGGGRLSTGQRQLVSFARAIIANPRIFVLDEATSSIDTETERLIQQAVDAVLEGRTSFIVAHRLSTIRSCDRILVISDGKIVEAGSHRQLMRKRGEYFNLYSNQFKEDQRSRILGDLAKPVEQNA
jgi:ATP-binding cassette subfamily B protein